MAEESDKTENTPQTEETEEELSLRYENKKELFKGGLLGVFIGLAVIVPGVSGSAVAIIFRLYEKLLYAFGNILKRFKKCARFLLPVAVGAVVGIVAGFFTVKQLLALLPFAVVALFAGLMFGSYPAVTDRLNGEKITPPRVALFCLGAAIPLIFSAVSVFATGGAVSLTDLQFYHYLLFLLLGFAVAVTQLVPGLSATALLMIFGCFTPLMESVSLTYWQTNPQIFIVYGCLAIGFLAGLVIVSKGLSRLLNRFHAQAFFTIAGLSLGTAVSMFFNREIWETYTAWATDGVRVWEIILGVFLFAGGVVLAHFFVRYEKKHEKNSPSVT